MRSRKAAQEQVAEVARRRLELLGAELAALRQDPPEADPPTPGGEVTSLVPSPPVPVAGPAAGSDAGASSSDAPAGSGAGASVETASAATAGSGGTAGSRGTAGSDGTAGSGGTAASAESSTSTGSDAEAPAVTDATSPEPQVERPARPGRHARRSIGVAGLFSGWVHDRLPPTMQGRIGLAPGHVTAVALMVALALGVTAWWVLRADADGEPVPASSPADLSSAVTVAGPSGVPGPSPVGGSPSAGVASGGEGEKAVVVVDVAGRVRRPGIATLPVGARVIDALDAAGGARPGVDLTTLNLARVLVDGEQIVVGVPPPGGIAAPAASASQPANGTTSSTPLVNLNTATQVELEELPGVGPVTAAAILQWRTDNGAFTAVDELLEVSGIGDATLAEIAPFVTL